MNRRIQQIEYSLNAMSKKELIGLIMGICESNTTIRHEMEAMIDRTMSSDDIVTALIEDENIHAPKEYKEAVERYFRETKDINLQIVTSFSVCEKLLSIFEADNKAHRHLMVASAIYGKAMKMLDKDNELWSEHKEKAYELAGRFYEIDSESAHQAISYYHEVKKKRSW